MLYTLSVNYVYAYTRRSVPVVSGLKNREDSLFILNFVHLSVVFFYLTPLPILYFLAFFSSFSVIGYHSALCMVDYKC